MYNKMKKGHEWLNVNDNHRRIGLVLFVILSIISAIIYLKIDIWPESFHYPTEEIKVLTEEGYRIIEENDFNSEYKLTTTVTTHTDKTKSLQLIVDGPNAEVTINVQNWKSDNQKITSTTHRPPNKVLYWFAILLFTLFPAIIGSILILILGLIIFYIIYGCSYLCYRFKKS